MLNESSLARPSRLFDSVLNKWPWNLFPSSIEPSFSYYTLDRYETSLLRRRTTIPRNVLNLWIVILMVAMTRTLVGTIESRQRHLPRNM